MTGTTTTRGISNTGNIGTTTLSATNGATVGGTLGVTGNTTLKGTLSSGAATLYGGDQRRHCRWHVGSDGNTTLKGTLSSGGDPGCAAVTNGATVGGTLGVQ